MDYQGSTDTAFKELFNKEYGKLCRYALTYLQDMHLAEDVVQETFIKIWEQKKDLITSDEIRFYLITAVRNNAISMLRKQNKEQLQFTEDVREPEPEIFITPSQMAEEEKNRTARVKEALNRLPPKCREVFLLIKLHGMSYKQAAESLDISVKTIENQMGKAIRILRDMAMAGIIVPFLCLVVKDCGAYLSNFLKVTQQ
jgi:RNA polymerase sigma-70 factor (ECF subfamily)